MIYICPTCQEKFTNKRNFIKHKQIHKQKYECTFVIGCELEFSSFQALQRHMKESHDFLLELTCPIFNCPYTGKSKQAIKNHLKVHQDNKPYLCTECNNYSSKYASGLTMHIRVHHTFETPYKCHYCDFQTKASDSLKRHIRIHTQTKPFQCNYENCHASFRNISSLTIHNRRHIHWKPYKCEYENCLYSSATSSELKRHIDSHMGIKRFKCEHCSTLLATSHSLKAHMERHEQQKSYQYPCLLIEYGTEYYNKEQPNGTLPCSIRCKTPLDLEYHIERNHTPQGIACKFQSESQLADFFDKHKIIYDRDWVNRISFKSCKNIEGTNLSARPDFHLYGLDHLLNAIVLVGNDEFCHRRYSCDLQRVYNIANALEQNPDFKGLPLVYIRFNPHSFTVNGKFYNHSLEYGHQVLLEVIHNLKKEDIQPGVNLIFIHYDRNNYDLHLFDDTDNNDYISLFKDCVIKIY